MTALLFAALVAAWGTTWFAIKLQLGPVPAEVSICYRFVLAAAVLWAGLWLTGRLRPVPPGRHGWIAVMGVTLFGLNFILLYAATGYIASGIVSVLFSIATVFNAFNQWLFLRRRPTARALLGAALGIAGIALLFGEQLAHVEANGAAAVGIALGLAGTFSFSLGNLVSMRATAGGLDLPNVVVRGMTWSSVFLALYALASGRTIAIDLSPSYLLSLLYLAVPGSVFGFLAYLSLVKRVGADRAAYATVLFPVVALAVSTVFEGYVWTPSSIAGLPLILLGNFVIFARLPPSGARARFAARAGMLFRRRNGLPAG